MNEQKTQYTLAHANKTASIKSIGASVIATLASYDLNANFAQIGVSNDSCVSGARLTFGNITAEVVFGFNWANLDNGKHLEGFVALMPLDDATLTLSDAFASVHFDRLGNARFPGATWYGHSLEGSNSEVQKICAMLVEKFVVACLERLPVAD